MLKKINTNSEIRNNLKQTKTEIDVFSHKKYILATMVLNDMIYLLQIWRQIKGYSSNGQRSHSNNKNNKKIKLLNSYRLQQFYDMFGKKRRDIFPTIIIAEYTNRLWILNWYVEWVNGLKFILFLASNNKGTVKIDPALLAKNIITGWKKKKKKKHKTRKIKIILLGTVGLPFLFTRYLYDVSKLPKLPFKITIPDDSRKKLGTKRKKKKTNKKKKK